MGAQHAHSLVDCLWLLSSSTGTVWKLQSMTHGPAAMVSSVSLFRNADSQATLQTYAIITSFDKLSPVILMHIQVPDVQFQINQSPALYFHPVLSGIQGKEWGNVGSVAQDYSIKMTIVFLFLVKREKQLHAKG